MIINNKLLTYNFIKKIICKGKQKKLFFTVNNNVEKIFKKKNLFIHSISNLIVPFSFNTKKINHNKYYIPILYHYYKSINLALKWIIKASKIKGHNKMPFLKALILECCNISKREGIAYKFKQEYIKKALVNRIFISIQ